jgi:hypothetical protein
MTQKHFKGAAGRCKKKSAETQKNLSTIPEMEFLECKPDRLNGLSSGCFTGTLRAGS